VFLLLLLLEKTAKAFRLLYRKLIHASKKREALAGDSFVMLTLSKAEESFSTCMHGEIKLKHF